MNPQWCYTTCSANKPLAMKSSKGCDFLFYDMKQFNSSIICRNNNLARHDRLSV